MNCASLIDARAWRFDYTGIGGCDSHCHLRTFEHATKRVVVLTECPDNHGTSITNLIEYLATHLCSVFCISPVRLLLIEHYTPFPLFGDPETYSLVTFQDYRRKSLHGPNWRHLNADQCVWLTGRNLYAPAWAAEEAKR